MPTSNDFFAESKRQSECGLDLSSTTDITVFAAFKAQSKLSKLVYVASPVRPILESSTYPDNWHAWTAIKQFALQATKKVKAAGHIPISPILAFSGVFDEYTEREKIEAACFVLLMACDELYVSPSHFSQFSAGIKLEREWAQAAGMQEVDYV
jgi:hypothetical protein